jgi:hypothetical protein
MEKDIEHTENTFKDILKKNIMIDVLTVSATSA